MTKLYKYRDKRTGEELDSMIRWLKSYGWRMRNGHLVHPDMHFSWAWAEAERLTKEAEEGDKVAQYLLEPIKK
jgi:hypothetical protein